MNLHGTAVRLESTEVLNGGNAVTDKRSSGKNRGE